jgi:hypothetical protein
VFSDRRELPAFACQAPLLSLPHLFGTMSDSIPREVPYLLSDPVRLATWRLMMAAAGPGLRVGLAWRGNRSHRNDRNRSVAPEVLAPLCDIPGLVWFILQQDATPEEKAGLAGGVAAVHDLGPALTDWADTAAAVAALDLVVTVDTAVAHLAGALARPTWLLLPFAPDWRWLLERDHSPWYPTLRLFRQPRPGDWPAVVRSVAGALAAAAGGGSGGSLWAARI